MAKSCLLIALIFALHAALVSAAPVTYRFTSTITAMFEHDAQTGTNTTVSQSELTGHMLKNGDMVSGHFTYEPSTPPSPFDTNGASDGFLVFSFALLEFSFEVASAGFSYEALLGPGSNIVLSDSSTHPDGLDGFSPFSEAAFNLEDFRSANINLFDFTGTAFNGYSLPTTLSLESFAFSNLHFAYLRKADGDQFHFFGPISSMQSSAIPEPPTLHVFLLGLVALVRQFIKQKRC